MEIWNDYTARYEETFDSCPLCGETENLDTKDETLVECRNCGLTLYGDNMIDLIKRWNTRTYEQKVREAIMKQINKRPSGNLEIDAYINGIQLMEDLGIRK
jgi:transcription initiation factor TFIIIB Brf1 subunit/transcription initiation factor TFIIB